MVTLISASETFAYFPQLYHAATGGSRAEAAIPLVKLLAGTNVKIIVDQINLLDETDHTVTGASGEVYPYGQLILATGSVTNYFGIPGLAEFSYNIKTIDGAVEFKKHLHDQLISGSKPELHYVIVGGGPTGIELSSALSEYMERIVGLHGVTAPKYRIDLVEAGPRLLPRSSEAHAKKIQDRLEKLGVHVMTGAVVEGETVDRLQLKGESIRTKTVVWTAGVANNPFFRNNADAFTLAKNGRVEVNEFMEAGPDIYVIGDNAATPHGGLAETAVGDARYVAADIARKLAGKKRKPYKQGIPIGIIPVGNGWAAVERGNLHLYGYLGWMMRRVGDFVGYSVIESLPRAIKVWGLDDVHQDECPICTKLPATA
jgi:NADH dehydrogenase